MGVGVALLSLSLSWSLDVCVCVLLSLVGEAYSSTLDRFALPNIGTTTGLLPSLVQSQKGWRVLFCLIPSTGSHDLCFFFRIVGAHFC